eukprot:2864120-Prymnesium_polylepis.1
MLDDPHDTMLADLEADEPSRNDLGHECSHHHERSRDRDHAVEAGSSSQPAVVDRVVEARNGSPAVHARPVSPRTRKLITACEALDVVAARTLVRAGVDVNMHVERTRGPLEHVPRPIYGDAMLSWRSTLLITALTARPLSSPLTSRVELVELLLGAGASVNAEAEEPS